MDAQIEKEPYDLKSAAKVFSRVGFALLAYLVTANLLVLLLQAGYMALFRTAEISASAAALLSMCALNILALPVPRLVLRGIPSSAPIKGKARASTMFTLAAIAFAFLYFGNMVGMYASSVLQSLVPLPFPEVTLELVSALPWHVALVVVVLVGPLAEEYVFRKLILDRTRVYGEKFSILFSAILFAFFHSSVQQFFYALLIGLLLGYLYLRTGSLWRCYAIHAVLNLFGSVLPLLLVQYCGYDTLLAAVQENSVESVAAFVESNPAGVFCILVFGILEMLLVLAGAILFFVYRKKLRFYPAELDLPRDTEATVSFATVGVILFIAFCVGVPILLALVG